MKTVSGTVKVDDGSDAVVRMVVAVMVGVVLRVVPICIGLLAVL